MYADDTSYDVSDKSLDGIENKMPMGPYRSPKQQWAFKRYCAI